MEANFESVTQMQNVVYQINEIKDMIYKSIVSVNQKIKEVAETSGKDISLIHEYLNDEEKFNTYQERVINNW